MYDITKVLQEAASVARSSSNDNAERGSRFKYKLIYPFAGTGRFKLLFNPASGLALRQTRRHNVGDVRVPCLQTWSMDCPVCKTVSEIESIKGLNLWRFKSTFRGLSFAQYVDSNYKFDNPNDQPAKNEIILLMYPWSVYRDLSTIISDAGQNAISILATNRGKVVKITRSSSGDQVDYRTEIDPFYEHQSFPTEEEYQDCLNNLPNLLDQVYPSQPTDEIINQVREVANKLREQFITPAVVNPGTPQTFQDFLNQQQQQANAGQAVQPQQPQQPQQPSFNPQPTTPPTPNIDNMNNLMTGQASMSAATDGKPQCFGQHASIKAQDPNRCLICPFEVECASQ